MIEGDTGKRRAFYAPEKRFVLERRQLPVPGEDRGKNHAKYHPQAEKEDGLTRSFKKVGGGQDLHPRVELGKSLSL